MENKNRLTFKQYMILSAVSIALFIALWNFKEVLALLSALFSYILPLFIGACIAFAINVPVRAFERMLAFLQRKCHLKARHTLNTYLSLILTIVAISAVIAVFVNFFVPQLAESGADIVERFKKWYPTALSFLKAHKINIDYLTNFDFNKVYEYIAGYFSFDNAMSIAGTIIVANTVISYASSTVSIAISAVSCIVFSIYMVTGKKKLNHQAHKLIYAYLPKRFADKACHIGSLFFKTFYSYIYSQCLDALILALLLYAGLKLFVIPYAGIICILTGVLALIPYFGGLLACVIGALLLLLVSPLKSLIFVTVFIVVQQLEGQFIYPHLVGSSIGLPAIWTLFAALIGGQMMGLFGVMFFIPLTAVVYALIKEGAGKRLQEKGLIIESPAESEEREKRQKLYEKSQKRKEQKEQKRRQKEEKNIPKQ